jgi:hypothetical protein
MYASVSRVIGVASFATSNAATVIGYVPELTGPVWRLSARALVSISMLIESLNTLAVSQAATEGEIASIWAIVLSAMARIAAWDSNLACVIGMVHLDNFSTFRDHYRGCMVDLRRWFFAQRDAGALVDAETHVGTMIEIVEMSSERSLTFAACNLHVLRTLIQYNRSVAADAQLDFFVTLLRESRRSDYSTHTAYWLAAYVSSALTGPLIESLNITEEAFNRRARAARFALLELRI